MEGKIMKWGNSYGLLIQKDEVRKRELKEGETVEIELRKKQGLTKLFGMCKFKRSMKEIMEDIREGYSD